MDSPHGCLPRLASVIHVIQEETTANHGQTFFLKSSDTEEAADNRSSIEIHYSSLETAQASENVFVLYIDFCFTGLDGLILECVCE